MTEGCSRGDLCPPSFPPHIHVYDSLVLHLVGQHWTMDTVTNGVDTRGRWERERAGGERQRERERERVFVTLYTHW
jgi:hypothetical protein